METIHLKNDILLFCTTADSFPDGVPHAWHQLHKMLDGTTGRTFYGISYKNEAGTIEYKAGVAEEAGSDAEYFGCETVLVPKGAYLAETVTDFPKQLCEVSRIFQMLLAQPGHAADAVCVEWYRNEHDVVCMVKQKEAVAISQ